MSIDESMAKRLNPSNDSELATALEDYMQRIESGEDVDRDEFLRKHAAIHSELAECIDGLDFVEQLAPGLRGSAPTPPDLGKGELIKSLGDYTILREIGRGGMGIVYEAHQLSLDRRVALKVLPLASLLDERQLRRFRNEARAAAALKHPNIVSVYGVGCERSVHFYAMELIDGADLATVVQRIQQQPGLEHQQSDGLAADTTPIARLSTQRTHQRAEFFRSVARLGVQAAEALHFAHQEGIVHRDIKPANLLLDRNGQLHITDFGLAQFGTGNDLTLTGDLIGTLRYMSPEQIVGKQVIDQRTDVYSLGVTLYECASGRPAFDSRERPELLRDIVENAPEKLANTSAGVPSDLATIIECAISKDRDDRYQDIGEMAADLARFIDNRPVLAKPPSALSRTWKWCVRNHRVVTATGATILLLAIGLVITLSQWKQALVAKGLLSSEVYSSKMRLAYESFHEGDIQGARHQFERATQTKAAQEQQFEWAYMSSLLGDIDDGKEYPCHNPTGLAFSPDGSAVYVSQNVGIDKWNLETDSREWSRKLDNYWLRSLLVVPSGTVAASDPTADVVYAIGKQELLFLDAKSGAINRRVEFDIVGLPLRNVALSSDATQLFLATSYSNSSQRDTEVHGYDLTTSRKFQITDNDVGAIQALAIDPQGRFIATSHRDHSVWLRSAQDWSVIRKLYDHRATVGFLEFSADGRFLVSGPQRTILEGWETRVRIWDLENNCEFDKWPRSQPGQSISLAPNAKWFAVIGSTGSVEVKFLTSERTKVLRGHASPATLAAWSADSRRLATADETGVRVWNIAEPSDWTSDATHVMSLAIADETTAFICGESWEQDPSSKTILKVDIPTGRTQHFADTAALPTGLSFDKTNNRLFCAEYFGSSQVWDLSEPDGQPLPLDIPGFCGDVALSADGKYLAVGKYDASKPNADVDRVEIWDVTSATAKQIAAHTTSFWPTALDFSPDDRHLAFSDWFGHLTVVDMGTQEHILNERLGQRPSMDLAFSADGRYLAVADADRRVWLWNTKTWEVVREPVSHAAVIYCLAFSPDSKRLATAGVNRMVSIWNVETLGLVARIQLEGASVSAIGFTPSGQRIVCAHMDRAVTVLHAPQSSPR